MAPLGKFYYFKILQRIKLKFIEKYFSKVTSYKETDLGFKPDTLHLPFWYLHKLNTYGCAKGDPGTVTHPRLTPMS